MIVSRSLSLCFLALSAYAASFDLDSSRTEIGFTLHDVLHTVHGTFRMKYGSIQWDPETGKASGLVVVDVASGASGSGVRDRRMHQEILESERYPNAVFTPDRVEGQVALQGLSHVDVHGMLLIHGDQHELVLHIIVQANGSQYLVSTHFTIPYVEWGMKNPSNFLLKVDGKVEMDVHAVTQAHT